MQAGDRRVRSCSKFSRASRIVTPQPAGLHELSAYPDTNPRPMQVRLFYLRVVQSVNKEIVEMARATLWESD